MITIGIDAIEDIAVKLYPLRPGVDSRGRNTFHTYFSAFCGPESYAMFKDEAARKHDRIDVYSHSDILRVMQLAQPVFHDHIVPFLDNCSDIQWVDKLFNVESPLSVPLGSLDSYKRLIAARLASNPEFEQLTERYWQTYRKQLQQFEDYLRKEGRPESVLRDKISEHAAILLRFKEDATQIKTFQTN